MVSTFSKKIKFWPTFYISKHTIIFLGYSLSEVNGRDEGKAAIVSIFLYIVAIFISWKAKDQIIVEKLKRSYALSFYNLKSNSKSILILI